MFDIEIENDDGTSLELYKERGKVYIHMREDGMPGPRIELNSEIIDALIKKLQSIV